MRKFQTTISVFIFIFFVAGCSSDSLNNSFNDKTAATNPGLELNKANSSNDIAQGEVEYEITIKNLAPATGTGASQPLSPPVIATHTPNFRLFHIGSYASDGVRQVAEDAVNDPLVSSLDGSNQVFETQTGSGVIHPGSSTTITIRGNNEYPFISFVSMLVNTNDGFTGMDKVRLPQQGSKSYKLRAYDAGTEENTELSSHIPGPCCGSPMVRVPTEEYIQFHTGIEGTGDLDPEIYNWEEPVVHVTKTG